MRRARTSWAIVLVLAGWFGCGGDEARNERFGDAGTADALNVADAGDRDDPRPRSGLDVTPVDVDFGGVLVSVASPARPIVVTNRGSDAARFSLIVSGNRDDFLLDVSGCAAGDPTSVVGTLAPGKSCTVMATARPSGDGARTATFALRYGPTVLASATLRATGITAQLAPSHRSVALPPTWLGGQSEPVSVVVTNIGNAAIGPLTTELTQDARGVRVVDDGCASQTLAPGEACVVGVVLAPVAGQGDVSAELRLVWQGAAVLVLPVSGHVLRPTTLVTDTPLLRFASTAGEPSERRLHVTNIGDAESGPLAVTLQGDGFVVAPTSDCEGALAPGATCTIVIRFSPDHASVDHTNLSIAAAPGGMIDVLLDSRPAASVLIGHWTFDGDLQDRSGFANHGTLRRGTTLDAPAGTPMFQEGHDGSALALDGGEFVAVAASPSIGMIGRAETCSVAAWVKASSTPSSDAQSAWLLSRQVRGTAFQHFALGLRGGAPVCVINQSFTVPQADIPLGQWVHLAMTYDGITCRVYQDGQLISKLDIGYELVDDVTSVVFGANVASPDPSSSIVKGFLHGALDDLRLYPYVLTDAEVSVLAHP